MASVSQRYNMIDGAPRNATSRSYRLVVWYSINRAGTDDIDVVSEGIDREDTFDSLGGAMTELADIIALNGGFDNWDDIDGRVSSCWLPYQDQDGYEIEFGAMIESVTIQNLWRNHGGYSQRFGRVINEREVNLTLRRVKVFR